MRTTSILSLLCVFFSAALHAQNKSSLDLIAGVDYAHYYSNHDDNTPRDILLLGQWDSTRGGAGWRFGSSINHRVGHDFLLKCGLIFSQHKFVSDYDFDFEENAEYKFYFLEFPFAIRREMEVRKFSPFIELGLAPVLYLSHSAMSLQREQGFLDKYEDGIQSIEFMVMLSGGFSYSLSDTFDAFMQPSFRYHLKGIEIWEEYKHNFYSFGVEFGIRRLFGD